MNNNYFEQEKFLDDSKKYTNREISWLHFNARVLQEAEDATVPLISRLRFLGIFSDNLDQFYKVRYALLKRIFKSGIANKTITYKKAQSLIKQINDIAFSYEKISHKIFDDIYKELNKDKIFIINEKEVTAKQKRFIRNYFLDNVYPSLVTVLLDETDEVPNINDNAPHLAIKLDLENEVYIKNWNNPKILYALVEIPKRVKRFVVLPKEDDNYYIILVDDVIRYCLDYIFNLYKFKSISAHTIKITRDAELEVETDVSKSFLENISDSLKEREKNEPVRFTYDKNIDIDMLHFLMKKFGIDDSDSIVPGSRYHNRRDYIQFPDLDKKEYTYQPITPLYIPNLSLSGSILDKISKKDYLLFTPYQSFSYVVKFIREAALDPTVSRIQITVYRLAEISNIISALINAIKNDKKVTVVVELTARFDEEANVEHAETLEEEGVEIIFGVHGLKVHSKICLIERKVGEKNQYLGFISTGNFNENTAKLYTDTTLFTANQEVLIDLAKLFDFFKANYIINSYRHILVSPHYTKSNCIELINQEIAAAKQNKPAYIKLKLNSLTHLSMIDKLYEASQQGVKIQLIIRGMCSLVPGIKGLSDNIEVISIIDKFLEHNRMYAFCNNNAPKVYISSADWMTRNLLSRIEVSCPIYDENIKQELLDIFEIEWNDNIKARIINSDNTNEYRPKKTPFIRSQDEIYRYYEKKLSETNQSQYATKI